MQQESPIMPSTRARARALPGVVPAVVQLARAFAWLLVLGIGVFAALLLVVRLVLFPNVEQYRDRITRAISEQIRQPVEIDSLATAWDGWNPKLVMTGFRVGPRNAEGSAGLLELPRVDLTLSWTSIPLLEPRLRELVIDSPRL